MLATREEKIRHLGAKHLPQTRHTSYTEDGTVKLTLDVHFSPVPTPIGHVAFLQYQVVVLLEEVRDAVEVLYKFIMSILWRAQRLEAV